MLEDIINKGVLEMADSPFRTVSEPAVWSGYVPVRVLIIVSILSLLFFAADVITLFPFIRNCIFRSKGCSTLEYSISTARIRNEVAILMFLPFCLVADRYLLYSPSFMNAVRPGLTVFCIMGALAAYLVVRRICFVLFRPLRMSSEALSTLKHILFVYFIALVPVMLLTAGLMGVFRVPDAPVRVVLLWETAFFYLLSAIRVFQFLASRCNIFATFLYLCALEFLPAGLLLASEFIQ